MKSERHPGSLIRIITAMLFSGALTAFPISAATIVNTMSAAENSVNNARPGDTIILANGTYNNFAFTINSSGIPGNPITFKAESGGGVNLTGTSGFTITGDYIVLDGFKFSGVPRNGLSNNVIGLDGASHCVVTNCAFYSCGYYKWAHIIVMSNESANNKISYNYLEDIIGQGIGVRTESSNINNHIHHNHINGTTNDDEGNGQEPIQIGQNQQTGGENMLNTLVEYNLIENMSGDADPELISNKTGGNIYRYNTFINNTGTRELVLRGGAECLVEYNYFDGSGIRVYGRAHTIRGNYIKNVRDGIRMPGGTGPGTLNTNYPETIDCIIEDNIIENTTRYGILAGGNDPYIRNNTVKNNSVKMNSDGYMYFLAPDTGGGMVWAGNTGEGNTPLHNDLITSGISSGTARSGTISPLTPADVWPDWLRGAP